ncbi:MAG: histidinol-phosphate transaminase [Eubacteriales bacterium]
MDKYLSKRAKEIVPYVPGEQPAGDNLIKLNTNENPYPPSPKAMQAMVDAVNKNLKKYPKPECRELRKAIVKVENLPDISYVYAGNGSDEILAFCFQAFFDPDKDVLFPDITYSFYPVYCGLYGLKYDAIPLDENLKINLADYNKDCTGIIFPNPNAPTGEYIEPNIIEQFVANNQNKVVIVDEAYIEFGGESVVPLIEKYPNLLIVRTMSKSHSLAGLRCGYAMGQPHLIDGIIRVKNSFNSYTCDAIAQEGAENSILDVEYKNETCGKIVKTREYTKAQLKKLGFEMTDSKSNFIFIMHPDFDGKYIFDKLRESSILVRHFSSPERINDYLRVSIGTDEEMDIVIEKLKDIVTNG